MKMPPAIHESDFKLASATAAKDYLVNSEVLFPVGDLLEHQDPPLEM